MSKDISFGISIPEEIYRDWIDLLVSRGEITMSKSGMKCRGISERNREYFIKMIKMQTMSARMSRRTGTPSADNDFIAENDVIE
jgi:hypothetical protein